jgi:hypothetical protein
MHGTIQVGSFFECRTLGAPALCIGADTVDTLIFHRFRVVIGMGVGVVGE